MPPSSESESESEEEWPPWLSGVVAVDSGIWDDVEVLEEGGTSERRPGLTPCVSIRMPEPRQAATGKRGASCRMVTIQKYSTILIASTPVDPPYIGLVEQIWRKTDAGETVNGKRMYKPGDFGVECYWFYRPQEVPADAWKGSRQQPVPGSARFRYDHRGAKLSTERASERAVLFSSHHTAHDYPDASMSTFGAGILAFDAFLQECKVHWPGQGDGPPLRYSIHGGKLVQTREPGFVVGGFLWCNSKGKVMFDEPYKRVFGLDGDWGDQATMSIVRTMQQRYASGPAKQTRRRNRSILDKYAAAMQPARRRPLNSEDGSEAQDGRAVPGTKPAAGAAAAVAAAPPAPRQPAAAARGGAGGAPAAAAAAAAAGSSGGGSKATVVSPKLPGLEGDPMLVGPGLTLPPLLDDLEDDDND